MAAEAAVNNMIRAKRAKTKQDRPTPREDIMAGYKTLIAGAVAAAVALAMLLAS